MDNFYLFLIAIFVWGCGGKSSSDRYSRASTASASSATSSSDGSPQLELSPSNFVAGFPSSRAVGITWHNSWSDKFEGNCDAKSIDCGVHIILSPERKKILSETISAKVLSTMIRRKESEDTQNLFWRSRYSAKQYLETRKNDGREIYVIQFLVFKIDSNNCVVSSLVIVPSKTHETSLSHSIPALFRDKKLFFPQVKVSQSLIEENEPQVNIASIVNKYFSTETPIFSDKIYTKIDLFFCPTDSGGREFELKSEAILFSSNRNHRDENPSSTGS